MAQSKQNRVTVAGTVTPELFEFIDNMHWKLRKTRSEVVGDVLLEWAKSEGFEPTETGEVPADETPSETPSDDSSEEGGPQAPAPATVKTTGRAKAQRAS